MNCLKCNSTIPDGAKFCPNCGASFAVGADVKPAETPVEEHKYFCEKCGLELQRGAKFCTVCGAEAKQAPDVKTTSATETFGEGAMSTVSLDKNSPSESLVSAMNKAAEPKPSDVIPKPSDAVPMPSNSVPTPSNSSFSATGYGTAAYTPYSAPAENAPTAAPSIVPAYSGEAVKPVKKGKGGIVALIIVGVLALLIAAGATFFFTNKATALSLIFGKQKYAAMVEGNLIKEVTSQIDAPALSNGIKSASELYAALAAVNGGYVSSYDGAAMMSNSAGNSIELDTKGVVEALSSMLAENYGTDCVKITASGEVTLTDSAKSLMGENADDVTELLDFINGFEASYTIAANDNTAGYFMEASSDKITINAKMLVSDDGKVYIALPFASDKAVMFECEAPESTAAEIEPLELDEKEIERLIGEVVEIYLENYNDAVEEMENGTMTANGVEVSGKLITAEFKGEDLEKLFSDIFEHIADDEYFSEKIVDYINECGGDITTEDYKEAITDIADISATNEDKLIIETIIDKNGNVLGKTYTAKAEGENEAVAAYVKNGSKEGLELCYTEDGEDVFVLTAENTAESETDGECDFDVTIEGESVGFNVKYSGVKTEKFLKNDVAVGTYEFSVKLPEDFSDALTEEGMAAVNNVTLTLSNTIDGDALESKISLDVPQYGNVSFTMTTEGSDDTSLLSVPENAIDATPILNGEIDPDAEDALEKFSEEITAAFEDISDNLPEVFDTPVPDFDFDNNNDFDFDNDYDTDTDFDFDNDNDYETYYTLADIRDFLAEDYEEMSELYAEGLPSEAEQALDDLSEKYDAFSVKVNSASEDMVDELLNEYWDLYDQLLDIEFTYIGF